MRLIFEGWALASTPIGILGVMARTNIDIDEKACASVMRWIEFLRDTRSSVCERVDKLLESRIATCDAVRMQLLAGARDQEHLEQLRRLLATGDFQAAAPAASR